MIFTKKKRISLIQETVNVIILFILIGFAFLIGCDENTKPDTTPPTVSITSPQNGTTVAEIVTINCNATDNEGISKVELWVNADSTGITDFDEPYNFEWNTATYANSSYTVSVRAYDTSDNWADSETITLILDNSNSYPTPSELYPISFENVSFSLKWSQNSNDDFQSYTLYESYTEDMNNETNIFSTNISSDTTYVVEDIAEIRYYRITTEDIYGLQSTSNIQIGIPFIINVPLEQPTIQAGINVATNGDTVLVQPGVYYENINFNGKLITVASLYLTTQDTSYISHTTIGGNQSGRVVTFENDEDYMVTLMGFTVSNGEGGIKCWNSSPSLINLTITNNIVGNCGSGILCEEYSSPIIRNAIISNNLAGDVSDGGGIACTDNSNPTIENVVITNNVGYRGGGIYCYNHSNPRLENVTIVGNHASSGSGVYCYAWSSPTLINTIVANNTGGFGGIVTDVYYSPVIEYCNVYDNESGNFLNCGPGIGCIELDPLFVDVLNEDYHLLPNSPCINAGNPYNQYNDLDGSRNDMGAYGGPNGDW